MKKIIGIYGGSFNPIHFGHIGVAKWVKEHTAVDEVWLMISPNNPLKDKKILTSEQERFEAVKEAVKDIPGLVASDFEFRLPKPSYMADTLRELTKAYPEYKFILIIGEDNLETLHKWKDYEYIVENFIIYVYPRRGYNKTIDVSKYPYMKFLYSAPYFDISSTEIRNKKQKHDEALEFADEVFQKVLSDTKQKEWFESLDNLEKARVEFISKAIALQVRADLNLELEPIEIENGPKPVLGWWYD